MNDVPLLVGGRACGASDGGTFERTSPVSGEVVSRAAAATVEDCDAAVAAAAAALPAWASKGPAERRAILNRAADVLDGMTEAFIKVGVAETGGTAGWYGFNVMLAANMLREAAAMVTQVQGEIIPSNVPDNLAMAVRRPAGVVLGIAPWNAPVILGVRAFAMPLACGNTAILKSSELCPAVHRLLGTALTEAGLPDGVLNIVSNRPADAAQVVERLVANPQVRRVNFTGSTRVGRIIGRLAAEHLKPSLLELGGNNPLLVLDDADLDEAVNGAAFSAFMNQGQICMSASRVIVQAAVADKFAARFAAKVATLTAGDPTRPGHVLGALVLPDAAVRCRELIDDAVAAGAQLLVGGQVEGALMQPTVVDQVEPSMRIFREESFGNLVSVVRVGSEQEAVEVANDTEYGLSAAVFTRDLNRGLRVAERVMSGICHINGPTVHDEAQMPFGGVKASGYGRFGGKAAIEEFTELRWVTIQQGNRHYPF